MADVFVSYSRKDQAFVRRLHGALVADGREVWVDWEGIPPSAKWMDEVRSAIDGADLFLFVVSPDSAASHVCRDEVAHASTVGKRFVPVVWRDTPPADLPDAVSAHNWMFLREGDDFEAGVARLLEVLDSNPEWVKAHTRLVTRAREWDENGRDRSRLLRGRDLAAADRALVEGAGRDPRPTALQSAYVAASRQAEHRGQRIRTGVLAGGLVVALVLAGFALVQRSQAEQNATLADQQRQVAEEQRGEAQTQRTAAEQQATLAKARELTAAAGRSLSTDPELSVLLAREAVDLAADEATDRGLRQALQASRIRVRYDGCPGGEIRSLDVSADGSRFVTATLGGSVCVWDRAAQRLLTTIQVPGAILRGAAIAPDGSQVAAASEDGAVAVWSVDGTRLARWRAHDDIVVDVAFSADGRYLASAGLDGLATLWSTDDWQRARSVPAVADDAMMSARFSPDGKQLLTTNLDLMTRAWDVETGSLLASYVGPTRTPLMAAMSSDGAFVATAAQDETARIWDAGTGTQLQVLIHGGEVYDLSFAADGSRLVTASADGSIRIWDVKSGDLLDEIVGHDGAVNAVQLTPDGTALLSAGRDGTAREWAASGAETLVEYPGHFGSVFSGDASPDGTRVVTVGGGDGSAIVHDAATGRELATIRGHEDSIVSAVFSGDGSRILTGSRDGTARLWDAATGEELQSYGHSEEFLNAAAMRGDGSLVVAGGEDSTVRAFEADGKPAWEHPMDGPIGAVELSPNDDIVYVGDITGLLVAYGIDGSERFRVATGGSGIVSIAASPDGSRLAILGFDARVRVLDLADQGVVLDIPPASGYAWQVHYSPDGTRLTTGGDDGAVHIFDAATGGRLADLPADSRDAFLAVFLDPQRVFVTTRGNQAMLLRCDLCGSTDQVRALAETRTTRDFTNEERVALLHVPDPGATPAPSASGGPAASAEPLPSPAATAESPNCPWVLGPCAAPEGTLTTVRFQPPLAVDLPPSDLLLGESATLIGIALATGDQLTFGDGREFVGSDGRSLIPLGDTLDDLELFFRNRTWMDVSPAREMRVDGRRARLLQITSDSTQELPYGAVGGAAFFWATGETLDLALIEAPGGPLIVFGDRISDTPQAEYDALFEAAVQSIRFR